MIDTNRVMASPYPVCFFIIPRISERMSRPIAGLEEWMARVMRRAQTAFVASDVAEGLTGPRSAHGAVMNDGRLSTAIALKPLNTLPQHTQ